MKRDLHISFQEYTNTSALDPRDQELLKEAMAARNSAYAPYSNFKVGSAVIMQNGVTLRGSNQENAAFPSGLCAERVALFAAASAHPQSQVADIAVYAEKLQPNTDNPICPCGACRQVLMEYEMKQESPIRVILSSDKGKTWIFESISSLLPFAFGR